MSLFKLTKDDFQKVPKDGKNFNLLKKQPYDNFNESILGLGKLTRKSKPMDAVSVIVDLEGFTNFCKQIDPQLAVPEYLSDFLTWLFIEVKRELTEIEYEEGNRMYSDFPFFSKYLGDGVLFLWNVEDLSDIQIHNIIVIMYKICQKYSTDFFSKISKKVVDPPTKLRCGIARGMIYSVGDGNDFVGPCINESARLQKLNSLSFSFSRRGLDPEMFAGAYQEKFIVKKVNIRGIGDSELVCVLKDEYDNLEAEDKAKFIEV